MNDEIKERLQDIEGKIQKGDPLTDADHLFLFTINFIKQNG